MFSSLNKVKISIKIEILKIKKKLNLHKLSINL